MLGFVYSWCFYRCNALIDLTIRFKLRDSMRQGMTLWCKTDDDVTVSSNSRSAEIIIV